MSISKKYNLIYTDPPWKQTKGGRRKTRPNQAVNLDYKTLSMNAIFNNHEKFCIENCNETHTVFMWAIDKFLPEIELNMKRLGYRLHARIIWNKMNGIAPAFTIRYSHEYLLWFYKGKFQKIDSNERGKWTTVLTERATKHSKKPLIAYNLIETMYPDTLKFEMYARIKREGWDACGNEI